MASTKNPLADILSESLGENALAELLQEFEPAREIEPEEQAEPQVSFRPFRAIPPRTR